VIKLDFRRVVLFTFLGSVLWIICFVGAGYLVGIMPFLKQYLKYIVVGIIVVITIPMIIGIIRRLDKAGKRRGN
jgi:membrane-associated protein